MDGHENLNRRIYCRDAKNDLAIMESSGEEIEVVQEFQTKQLHENQKILQQNETLWKASDPYRGFSW